MKDILAFDSLEDSFLFEEERTSKPDKSQVTKCLEPFVEIDDFCFNKATKLKPVPFLILCRW